MLWHNVAEGGAINVMVAGLGDKDAKDYCEIEMLNEKLENARVAAGAAISALKGFYDKLLSTKSI